MSHRLHPQQVARLSLAAATGLAMLGCDRPSADSEKSVAQPDSAKVAPLTNQEGKACCMGLNECKGKGGCAVPESHSCAGKNDCKGKGGCNMHCPK